LLGSASRPILLPAAGALQSLEAEIYGGKCGPASLKERAEQEDLLSILTTCKLLSMEIPRLSSKEALILRLLTVKGEMYGLQLVNDSDGGLKRGTVYVTLSRMADKGYVDSRTIPQNDGSGIPKRLFRATGYGARVMHAWEIAHASLALEEA
jgi:DNA-binding PadR family transcriptional regulator